MHLLTADYHSRDNDNGASSGGSTFSFSNLRRKSSSLFLSDLSLGKRRDSSPTRLKRAVAEFASKMKRVTAGKHLSHLEVPKIEFGLTNVKTNDVVAARGRRPSIAPVPAMLGDDSTESSTESSDPDAVYLPARTVDISSSVSATNITGQQQSSNKETTTNGALTTTGTGTAASTGQHAASAPATAVSKQPDKHFENQWTFPVENSV